MKSLAADSTIEGLSSCFTPCFNLECHHRYDVPRPRHPRALLFNSSAEYCPRLRRRAPLIFNGDNELFRAPYIP